MFLSEAQKRILCVDMTVPGTPVSNIGGYIYLKGLLNSKDLTEAIKKIIRENKIFNTIFIRNGSEIEMEVKEPTEIQVPITKFANEKECLETFQQAFEIPLDIYNGQPLLQIEIGYTEEDTYIFLKAHHIISDGWTYNLILNDIQYEYDMLRYGTSVNKKLLLNNSYEKYCDYSRKEKEYIDSEKYILDEKYWYDMVRVQENENFILDTDDVKKAKRKKFVIDDEACEKILKFAHDNNITINTFFLGLFSYYLLYYYNLEYINIGVGILNRLGREERSVPGMFVSTMPYRQNYDSEQTVLQMLSHTYRDCMKSYRHQRYPYNALMNKMRRERNQQNNLYQVMFSFLNYTEASVGGEHSHYSDFFSGYQSESLRLLVREWGGGNKIDISFDYKESIFDDSEIEKLFEQFLGICLAVIDNGDKPIGQCNILTEKEMELHKMLHSYQTINIEKDIYSVFAGIADKNPDKCAVIHGNKQISYGKLKKNIDKIACILSHQGVGSKDIVRIRVNNSIPFIEAVFAILKLGASYIPLSSDEKIISRFENAWKDLNICLELTEEDVLEMERMTAKCCFSGCTKADVSCDDTAYYMFTSGTTGEPKGIEIKQRGILNLILNNNYACIEDTDRILQLSDNTFDGSVFGIFGSLLNGALLVLIDEESRKDPVKIVTEIKARDITMFFVTTAMLNILSTYYLKWLKNVKKIIFGGEQENIKCLRQAFAELGSEVLVHAYGPTENTVFSLCYSIGKIENNQKQIPIGKPIAGTGAYVLDRFGMDVPCNVEGQLYLSGNNLFNGYLNNKDKVSTFIEHNGERIYKTGDYVFINENGEIVFMERKDSLCKIRGFRVNLIEVESLIYDSVPQIEELFLEYSGKELTLFYIKNNLSYNDVPEKLKEELPSYMLPHLIIEVDSLPLKSSGKVDIAVLRAYKDDYKKSLMNKRKESIVQNNSQKNELILNIIRRSLDNYCIDGESNFYSMGGDSIKAIMITNELRQKGYSASSTELLSANTLTDFINSIQSDMRKTSVIDGCDYSYSPMQNWVIRNSNGKSYDGFAQALKVDFSASKEAVDKAIQKFADDHRELHCKFDEAGIHIDLKTNLLTCIKGCEENIDKKLLDSLNIKEGRLIAYCIQEREQERSTLYIAAHHFIIDAVSWSIFLNEISNRVKEPESCVITTSNVYQWIERINQLKNTRWFERESDRWKPILNQMLDGSYCFSQYHHDCREYEKINMVIKNVPSECSEEYILAGILIAIANCKMEHTDKNKPFLIFREGHGRDLEEVNDVDISSSIGWFTSRYPMLIHEKVDIKSCAKIIGDTVHKGINGNGYQLYIQERLVDEDQIHNYINFNYLGNIDSFQTTDNIYQITDYYIGGLCDRNYFNHMLAGFDVWLTGSELNIQIVSKKKFITESVQKRIKKELANSLKNYQTVGKIEHSNFDEFNYLFGDESE